MAVKPTMDFDFGFTAMDADELDEVQTVKKEATSASEEALTCLLYTSDAADE